MSCRPEAVFNLRNLDMSVVANAAEGTLRQGQVMWGTELQSQFACIAWDW